MPVVIVDWVLGNDYLGADNPAGSSNRNLYPLGGVDINEARFVCGGTGRHRAAVPSDAERDRVRTVASAAA